MLALSIVALVLEFIFGLIGVTLGFNSTVAIISLLVLIICTIISGVQLKNGIEEIKDGYSRGTGIATTAVAANGLGIGIIFIFIMFYIISMMVSVGHM